MGRGGDGRWGVVSPGFASVFKVFVSFYFVIFQYFPSALKGIKYSYESGDSETFCLDCQK